MNKIDTIQRLDILNYLKDSGVVVDEQLCSVVPDEVAEEKGTSKVVCVIDALVDDVNGILAGHFADYYNRFPEKTEAHEIPKLQKGFQKFVGQILFGKKDQHAKPLPTVQTEKIIDTLSEEIDTLISAMRIEWLQWSVSEGYKKILTDMRTLLPLLRKKYADPMLASNANMMREDVYDVIPDEYVDFLHDILIMLCSIYNNKYKQIQEDERGWKENYKLMMDIHHIASFLYSTLAWHVLDTILEENSHSVKYLARELIEGINVLYFWLEENHKRQKRNQKDPPEKE